MAALACLLAVAARAAIAAPADAPRESVLRGEVVDTGCFVIGGRKGEAHRHCALSCANAGENLGVLDDQTKRLFVVVQDLTGGAEPNPLLAHVAQRVEVRGTIVERGGISGVVVRQVKSLSAPVKR